MGKSRAIYEPGYKFPGTMLTYVSYIGKNRFGQGIGLFMCDCGRKFEMAESLAATLRKRSCGCVRKKKRSAEWESLIEKDEESENFMRLREMLNDKNYVNNAVNSIAGHIADICIGGK